MKREILAICGSTRKGSSNKKILCAIKKLYESQLDIDIYTDIHLLPHFNPDIDEKNLSNVVKEFLDKIENAAGVLICTPEYVFSLPGTLKNALEWTVSTTVFSYKTVAFIVVAASGEKAFEELDLILSTLVQKTIPPHHKLLVKGGQQKLADDCNFIYEQTKLEVQTCLNAFISAINDN